MYYYLKNSSDRARSHGPQGPIAWQLISQNEDDARREVVETYGQTEEALDGLSLHCSEECALIALGHDLSDLPLIDLPSPIESDAFEALPKGPPSLDEEIAALKMRPIIEDEGATPSEPARDAWDEETDGGGHEL